MNQQLPLCLAVIFSTILIGCTDLKKVDVGEAAVSVLEDGENKTSDAEAIREFNVENPHSFVFEQFKAEPKPKEVLSIDENGVVKFFNQERSIELPSELIVVSRTGPSVSIRVNSQPMSLEDARIKSISMCELVGISNDRITEWFSSKKYEDVLTSDCLQIGELNHQSHSVEIDMSFNDSLPWSVSYVITYSSK